MIVCSPNQVWVCDGGAIVKAMFWLQQMADEILQTVPGRSTSDSYVLILLLINFQNLLFYYDSDQSSRPSGVIFLEVELWALAPFSGYNWSLAGLLLWASGDSGQRR